MCIMVVKGEQYEVSLGLGRKVLVCILVDGIRLVVLIDLSLGINNSTDSWTMTTRLIF